MQDDNPLETGPEIIKPDMAEAEKRYDQWNSAMTSEDVPPFAGEDATFPAPESTPDLTPTPDENDPAASEFNEGIADAAALTNYGLDAAARKYGVETVVQGIKTFDASNSTDPIKDLYNHLGIDTTEEVKEVHEENIANQPAEAEFKESIGTPANANRSPEGALKAIADMKELIAEVEGADPRYEDLRQGAKAAGKGVFEYAVESFGRQGLVELFGVLKEQREKKTSEEGQPSPEDLDKEQDKQETAPDAQEEQEINTLGGQEKNSDDQNPKSPETDGFNLRDPNDATSLNIPRETLNPDILKANSPENPDYLKNNLAA